MTSKPIWLDDDVNRAACFEAAGLRHLKRFHHDALTGERRITVNQYRHDEAAARIEPTILARTHRPFGDRSHDFEVRRVEREREVHLTTRCHHVG